MAQTGQRVDPYGSFDFHVELDGILSRTSFQEASGFDSAIDVSEYREGGDNETLRKVPAKAKYSNIVLKWGTSDDADLYKWHMQWVKGDPAAKRKNGSIILLDRQGNEKIRWNFVNAWPVKWTGPSFNAKGNDIAIETLELAHEGLERA
jgi:phage tail-like protein